MNRISFIVFQFRADARSSERLFIDFAIRFHLTLPISLTLFNYTLPLKTNVD